MRNLLAALLALASAAASATDPAYLGQLQAEARAQRLAEDPYWHRLLHYRPRLVGGVLSVIDQPEFFVAPDGKTNPQAELDATLASFFSDTPRFDEPPQCRVRARYMWLKERLAFDAARLPEQDCEFFGKWEGALDAGQVHLVFAANDLNSPATMYGHTLMRVDAVSKNRHQPLLSFAVSYAAAVAEGGNPVAYIAEGLAGGFVGEFSLYPYHEKVKQYARINHRDLWEYPLALTREEIRRMLWHLWELRGVGSDYYFLSENCSYMLLSLIETARPGLSLSAEFDDLAPYTIPVDTLRELEEAGLLGEPVFRPSQARRLKHHLAQLEPGSRDWVLEYASGQAELDDPRLAQAPDRERARMLETAHDYLFFRFQKTSLQREVGLKRARAVLVARSEVATRSEFAEPGAPATRPEHGHETSRLDIGARHGLERTAMVLRARGAYHDRLDPPAGYMPGDELEFFHLGLLADDEGVHVSDFKVVNVQALAAWDRAFRPWSWQAAGGARRYGLDALAARPGGKLGGYAEGGPGITFSPLEPLFVYAFAIASADINESAEDGYAIAAGARLGVAAQWGGPLSQQLEFDALDRVAGGAQEQAQVRLGLQWHVTPRDGLRLALTQAWYADRDEGGAELRWLRYF
jgi:hypothetical protein